MSLRTRLAVAPVMVLIGLASPSFAHEAAKGPNGGLRVDAGKFHTELVVDGTTKVTVFLGDAEQKAIPAAGFTGNAILVIDGKSQRFPLEPADGSKLVGIAPAPVLSGVKGAIQLTAPDGSTAQGKF